MERLNIMNKAVVVIQPLLSLVEMAGEAGSGNIPSGLASAWH